MKSMMKVGIAVAVVGLALAVTPTAQAFTGVCAESSSSGNVCESHDECSGGYCKKTNSCAGRWSGGQLMNECGTTKNGNCYCDANCVYHGDCCEDICDYCGDMLPEFCGCQSDNDCDMGEVCDTDTRECVEAMRARGVTPHVAQSLLRDSNGIWPPVT